MKNSKSVLNMDLEDVVKEDCETWNKIHNNSPDFYRWACYDKLQIRKDFEYNNEYYSLYLNDSELWYGTLKEINAVVKVMIKIIDTPELYFEKSKYHTELFERCMSWDKNNKS